MSEGIVERRLHIAISGVTSMRQRVRASRASRRYVWPGAMLVTLLPAWSSGLVGDVKSGGRSASAWLWRAGGWGGGPWGSGGGGPPPWQPTQPQGRTLGGGEGAP